MPQQRPLEQHFLFPTHQISNLLSQSWMFQKLHICGLVVSIDQLLDFGLAIG